MAIDLIFLLKVSSEHLRRLIYCVLDLDGYTTTSLGLLDYVHCLMVNLQRSAKRSVNHSYG